MKSDILGIIGGGQLGMFMCIAAKIGAKTIVFSTEKTLVPNHFVTDIYWEVLMTKQNSMNLLTVRTYLPLKLKIFQKHY